MTNVAPQTACCLLIKTHLPYKWARDDNQERNAKNYNDRNDCRLLLDGSRLRDVAACFEIMARIGDGRPLYAERELERNLGNIKNPTYSRMTLQRGMRDRGPPAFTLGWARRAAPQTVELLDLCSTDTVKPERCPRTLVPRYSQGHATTLRRYG